MALLLGFACVVSGVSCLLLAGDEELDLLDLGLGGEVLVDPVPSLAPEGVPDLLRQLVAELRRVECLEHGRLLHQPVYRVLQLVALALRVLQVHLAHFA